MWDDIEKIDCLSEAGQIMTVVRQQRSEGGFKQERWWSASRGGEELIARDDGHFETANGDEIIARFPN